MASKVGWIELGRIGAPYGVKGWMHVESHTDPTEGLLEYREWVLRLGDGKHVTRRVAEGHLHSGRLVARLEGIEDRDAAALLTGAVIEIDRAELPPTGDREYYRADLVGLKVRNLEGVELGTVAYFMDAPTGPVMVVRDERRESTSQSDEERGRSSKKDTKRQLPREHWVLATPRHLRKVELASGLVLVDWPADLD